MASAIIHIRPEEDCGRGLAQGLQTAVLPHVTMGERDFAVTLESLDHVVLKALEVEQGLWDLNHKLMI